MEHDLEFKGSVYCPGETPEEPLEELTRLDSEYLRMASAPWKKQKGLKK